MKDTILLCLGVLILFLLLISGIIDVQMQENKTIETQKATIERLNNQLSKMDTLHDECFKVSEITKKK